MSKLYFRTNLTNAEKIQQKINEYQNAEAPFVCSLNIHHGVLEPVIVTLNQTKDCHMIILRCTSAICKHEKHDIPEFLLHDDQ